MNVLLRLFLNSRKYRRKDVKTKFLVKCKRTWRTYVLHNKVYGSLRNTWKLNLLRALIRWTNTQYRSQVCLTKNTIYIFTSPIYNLVQIGNKSTMATTNQMYKRFLRFYDLVLVKNNMYLFVYSSYFFCIWYKPYQLLIITKKDKKQAVYIQSKLLISI